MAKDRLGQILKIGDYAILKVKITGVLEDKNVFNVRIAPAEPSPDRSLEVYWKAVPHCQMHSFWLEKVNFGLEDTFDGLIA